MNKFKDAIYGERKKIVILNFLLFTKKKISQMGERQKFMNFNGSLASIDCL